MNTKNTENEALIGGSELNAGLGYSETEDGRQIHHRTVMRHMNGRAAINETLFDGIVVYVETFDDRGVYEKTESLLNFRGMISHDTRCFSDGKIVSDEHKYYAA